MAKVIVIRNKVCVDVHEAILLQNGQYMIEHNCNHYAECKIITVEIGSIFKQHGEYTYELKLVRNLVEFVELPTEILKSAANRIVIGLNGNI